MALLPITNPLINEHIKSRQQDSQLVRVAHKLEIEGIYPSGKRPHEPAYEPIRAFCSEHHIEFTLREFNSAAFVQDREGITRLPAFHIYYKDEYETSFYEGEDPNLFIQDILDEERGRKRKAWYWRFYSTVAEGKVKSF